MHNTYCKDDVLILPFPSVKLEAPLLDVIGPTLHGVLCGDEDAHATVFRVQLGNASQRGYVLLDSACVRKLINLSLSKC